MVQAELIQQPAALNRLLSLPALLLQNPTSAVLALIWPCSEMEQKSHQINRPVGHWWLPQESLEPVGCCSPWSQSLAQGPWWELREWRVGQEQWGGWAWWASGEAARNERQKRWQLQMRAQGWSSNHSVESKLEEKVYVTMAKYLERKGAEH